MTTLGPEGPSFRPHGRLLPASGRSSGSIHRPSPSSGWALSEFIGLIASQLRAGSGSARRHNAVAIYGMIVGALQLARAVSDKRLSDEILESGVSAALAAIKDER